MQVIKVARGTVEAGEGGQKGTKGRNEGRKERTAGEDLFEELVSQLRVLLFRLAFEAVDLFPRKSAFPSHP